jgi:CarD family transcriptional regulator
MEATFAVSDKAVYPVHGVAEVVDIETREIGGSRQAVYVLKIVESGLKIMVPCQNAAQVGLREIIDTEDVVDVYDILRSTDVASDNQTWNRRYREYMEKIKTGSVYEIAEVLRDLARLRVTKDLSFGERRMLDTARGLLVRELALAKHMDEDSIVREIEAIFDVEAA